MARKFVTYDKEFRSLTQRINTSIVKNKEDVLMGDQEAQVKKLFDLENKFKQTLVSLPDGKRMYLKFINFILLQNGNILSCRPFFREKIGIFHKEIYRCIREKNIDKLITYNINYQFIKYVIDNWEGRIPTQIDKDYKEFLDARRVLIENNIPLAINRASIFYQKTLKVKKNDLDLLDLIDVCIQGLMSGIDKYSGKYTTVWRSVCIGMMVGLMIRKYSESLYKLTPTDKKILYRVNMMRFRENIDDMDFIVKTINEGLKKDAKKYGVKKAKQINLAEIDSLINSFAQESDGNVKSDKNLYDFVERTGHQFVSDCNVEQLAETNQAMDKMMEKIHVLNFIELKIVRLKGVAV